MKKLSYRPEIDGLRTIAVLSVIIYHSQIMVFEHNFLKGGFVGVDIFFVISGYLISRILLNELFNKGKISFLQFYERRARRILPILFTVFLASFPLAYKYLIPNQFIEYSQSILSATFFGSNIFFYFTNTQYGAEDSLFQPFLHTWSLGVEEQFYILFPIVLLLSYKFFKNYLVTIIAVLILISLQYADWQSTKNIQFNFFMLTSRLWELGIGSLLAFYELKYGRVRYQLLNQTMPLLGFFLISYSIILFNNQTPHPSIITLLPTLGTALIILYSLNKIDLVGKVLCWKPIVGIGLISYSMYLWHYPIFAFARIVDTNGLHNDEKYLLIFLTIFLSIISYFLIEKPFRNKNFITLKKLSSLITICLIIIIAIYFKSIDTDGFKDRYPKFYDFNNNRLTLESWSIAKSYDDRDYNPVKKNILVIGNSHAKDFFNGMVQNNEINSKFSVRLLPPPDKEKIYQRLFIPKNKKKISELVIKNDLYKKSDLIILSINLTNNRLESLEDLFIKIKEDKKNFLILSNKLEFNNSPKSLSPSDNYIKRDSSIMPDNINKFAYKIKNKKEILNDKLKKLSYKYNFSFYNTQYAVCESDIERCTIVNKNFKKYYYNFNHWTLDGAKFYVKKLIDNGFINLLDQEISKK